MLLVQSFSSELVLWRFGPFQLHPGNCHICSSDLDSLHRGGLRPHGLPPTATLGGPKQGGNKEVLLLNSAVTTSLAGGTCFHEMQRKLGFVGYY